MPIKRMAITLKLNVAGLIEVAAENEAEPVLQLFVVQHDTTVPADVEPVLIAVHVLPDATHVYAFVAIPINQTEEVFINCANIKLIHFRFKISNKNYSVLT